MRKYSDPNICISGIFCIFNFTMKNLSAKMEKNIYFLKECVHLGKNTFPYCSRILVVYIHVNVFFAILQNRINLGSNSKTTDKHAADGQKAVCWGVK